jgi:hypothetical protein
MTRAEGAFVAVVAVLFCAAPTPGDVGGCGRTPVELDEGDFAYSRKLVDCERCRACGLATERCTRACDGPIDGYARFPKTCRPLRHDGDVCIRALRVATCAESSRYLDDAIGETPPECEFCRVPDDAPVVGSFTDAGGGG